MAEHRQLGPSFFVSASAGDILLPAHLGARVTEAVIGAFVKLDHRESRVVHRQHKSSVDLMVMLDGKIRSGQDREGKRSGSNKLHFEGAFSTKEEDNKQEMGDLGVLNR